MHSRRTEGTLLFLAPLTRGGRGGWSCGIIPTTPRAGFFNNPEKGAFVSKKRLFDMLRNAAPPSSVGADLRYAASPLLRMRRRGLFQQPQQGGGISAKRPSLIFTLRLHLLVGEMRNGGGEDFSALHHVVKVRELLGRVGEPAHRGNEHHSDRAYRRHAAGVVHPAAR